MTESQSFEELIQLLQNDDPVIRIAAIRELHHYKGPGTDAIIPFLKDPNVEVRQWTAEELGDAPPAYVAKPLIEALKDEDSKVRSNAADALGKTRNPIALQPLIAVLLNDPEPLVRQAATIGLLFLAHTDSVDALLSASRQDTNVKVRAGAIAALSYIDDERVVQTIIGALSDPAADIRIAAAVSLARRRSAEAIVPLLQCLDDPQINGYAARALGKIGDVRAVEPLIKLAVETQKGIDALGDLKDIRAVAPLLKLYPNSDHYTRVDILRAIVKIDPARAFDLLIAALHDDHPVVQQTAILGLGRLRDLRAIKPLLEFLNSSNERRFELDAVYALGHFGSEAVEPLTSLLNHKNDWVRTSAFDALQKLKA